MKIYLWNPLFTISILRNDFTSRESVAFVTNNVINIKFVIKNIFSFNPQIFFTPL